MKKVVTIIAVVFIVNSSFAQILNPVKLSYNAVKKSSTLVEVHVKAMVDPTWHIYSIYNPDGGAVPTSLSFTNAKKIGKVKESGKMKTVYEDAFKVNQKYFENTVDFIQTVKVQPGIKKVSGKIEYEVCNDRECLPPKTVPFEIAL
jgi:thiol:disulfide interchange protein DsbD